jgi:cell division protein FtsN
VVAGVAFLVCAGALAWYFRSELQSIPDNLPVATSTVPEPARKSSGPSAGNRAAKPDVALPDESERFEFYDMLPDAEVEVAVQPNTSGGATLPPVSLPGTYVVQAGAFPNFGEADKVKARLALLGIVSEIQAAEANGARFHRVRIGPIDNLDQLNRLRGRLRQNGIEYLVIPVGE